MKKLTVLLFSIIALGYSKQQDTIEFYVSPNGNDSNIGT
ncbi:MAG: hypothetical protein ACI93P_001974, partial [bacterium]